MPYLELNRDNWVLFVADTQFSHVLLFVSPHTVLELTVLCCAVLCCAVLCCAVLCCAVLCPGKCELDVIIII
jgi:hypothetical protein